MSYDFAGWATRNDMLCSDGRTIRQNAFKDNDGQTVPLVWNHRHNEPFNVLGHALLENRDEGVYTYCTFNDSEAGQNAKVLVQHGDVTALSIYANRLKQNRGDVLHGNIREVSLVLAGANPGAYIDSVMAHGEEVEDECVIYTGEPLSVPALSHADQNDDDEGDETVGEVFASLSEKQKQVVYFLIGKAMKDGNMSHADGDDGGEDADGDYDSDEYDDDDDDDDEDDGGYDDAEIAEVFDTLSDEQKNAVYAIVGQAMEEAAHSDEGGYNMKYNVFDSDMESQDVLSHSDEMDIISLAKNSSVGTLQNAMSIYAEENDLQHDAVSGGFLQTEADGNVSWLFPEYKDLGPAAPELITNDQGWIGTVMAKVHKSPISRIRTRQVDIRNIEALRAKGYQKGKQKSLSGNFALARRSTDPQTVYVKNALHRDDIVDITDFDYVQYLYNIDRMMLNEELATAIMLGDGRDSADPDKIKEEHVRPIWLDDELYTMHYDIDLAAARSELQGTNTGANFGENYILAEAMVNKCLYAREKFKGSGQPDMFIEPHMLNVMLLARDLNGRRIYSGVAELATALNVGKIYTAEQFQNKTRTVTVNGSEKTKKLVCLIVNLADYSLGSTKGGEITHFTQFDIDFNQEKSLIETRVSGALTRVYSAIAIEEDVTSAGGNG